MNALDAYKDTLKELDKTESPTFSVRDFNYFYNQGVSKYVDSNYKMFDIMGKDQDDIRHFLEYDKAITPSGVLADLPTDYRHLLHLAVQLKFKVNVDKYRKDQVVTFYPERMKSSQKGFRQKNAYGQPNYKRCYYEIVGTKLHFLIDAAVHEIGPGASVTMDYVKQLADVYLNPDPSSGYNNPTNNTVLPFAPASTRNHIYFEIIKVCTAIFLENIESGRYPTVAQQALTT